MRSLTLLTLSSLALAVLLLTPQALLAQYTISTVAGGGPNDLAELSASIGYPGSVALDANGNTYIADFYSSQILEVDNATGILTVVAGNGTLGYSGDGGPATSAALNGPLGVFVDGSGNIFIADTDNCVIREVSGGNISTVAGNALASPSPCGYAGDGNPATSALLNDPTGVFVDASGNIYIADADNSVIRAVNTGTQEITIAGVPIQSGDIATVAGNGTICVQTETGPQCGDGGAATSAQLDFPQGVFLDSAGNIFIADTNNSVIRVVNPGTAQITIAGVIILGGDIQTVAGVYYDSQGASACLTTGDGGLALSAYLCAPTGVFVDSSEDIFIADWGNSAIREILASGVNITTPAGTLGAFGYSPNGTAANQADLNYPSNMVVDSSGDLFIADTNNFVIREVPAPIATGDIQTTVGNNTLAYSGDGGLAVNAELNYPGGVFLDSSDDVFIADTVSSVIREVAAATGDIQTVAGNGTDCSAPTAVCGDGGLAASAQLNNPYGVFVDPMGNVFIADTEDNRIRVVNTSTTLALTFWGIRIAAGDIATVAGTGTQGYGGDGAAATNAELFSPYGVFVDSAENIFIADKGNHAIREVAASTGIITTVAGTATTMCSDSTTPCGDGGPATSAKLSFPDGVFVDSSENIYIADTGDNRIRVVNTSAETVTVAGVAIPAGDIATVAGTGAEGYSGDDAAAISATLAGPSGVFVDTSGDIFITDTANFVIREVVASSGFIATVAGDNAQGFSGDGGPSTSAELNTPIGLFGDSTGNLFVADSYNSRIRKLVLTAVAPSATTPSAQTTSPGGTATYSIQLNANTGNPKYPITLSCLQSSLPTNATCSFSPPTITPGPLPVPFTLTITVPTSSASLEKPKGMRLQLFFAFVPLAGILFAGVVRRNNRQRWLWLAGLCVFLILLNACGGSSSPGSGTGVTYNVTVQGTTTAQPTPVTITTATLIVQ
jgi:hypothetical protein